MTEIRHLLHSDPFAAIEHLHRQGSPLEIAAQYQSLVVDLYWKAHDLPSVVLLGRAGILHCLTHSVVPYSSPEAIEKFRSVAKALAYNVGSFTWPGWEEPGIVPTPDQIAFGQDCAHLNLRLALELRKPPKALANAHWLVGAHALASHNFDLAESEFHHALQACPPTDAPSRAAAAANAAYLALAQQCKSPTDPVPRAAFAEITAHLSAQTDEDSPAYLNQLLIAHRHFHG